MRLRHVVFGMLEVVSRLEHTKCCACMHSLRRPAHAKRSAACMPVCVVMGRNVSSCMRWAQVVGEKERVDQTVNVRTRDNVVHGEHKLADVLKVLQAEKAARSLEGHFGEQSNGAAAAAPAAPASNGSATVPPEGIAV